MRRRSAKEILTFQVGGTFKVYTSLSDAGCKNACIDYSYYTDIPMLKGQHTTNHPS